MIPPQTIRYREALAAPHEAYGRVEVWRGGVKIDELNQFTPDDDYSLARPVFYTGTIRATLTSRVSRTLSMQVPDWLFPWEPDDLLHPYGTYLHCYRGVRYGSGSVDEFPTFRGPITRVVPGASGRLTVSAADLAYEVVRNGFAGPQPAVVGSLVEDEYRRLVLDAFPTAVFGSFDPDFWERVPELSYDTDRGASLDNLAKTASAFWYALADGTFTLRRVPWTVPLTRAPIALTDGDGGTLFTAYPDRSSEGIHNRIVLSSERVDGGVPVYAMAEDLDPASPTYIYGPFLVKSTQVRVTAGLNGGQVSSAVKTILAQAKARTDSWQLTCVPDGSIELGDPLNISFKSRDALQVVAGFTIPVEGAGVMSIDGRSLVASGVEA